MGRNEEGFNLDDMMEIFGDVAPANKAAGTALKDDSAPEPHGAEELTPEEQEVLRAFEERRLDRKRVAEEARRSKDAEAKRVVEEAENSRREALRRDSLERQEQEARRARELEILRRNEVEKLEEERRSRESAAQAEDLAEKARNDRRLAELLARARGELAAEGAVQEPLAEASTPLPVPPAEVPPVAVSETVPAEESDPIAVADIGQPENDAFCAMLEETRKVMLGFLGPLIGVKPALKMLAKSLEKARAKAPEVLRDANWTMDGSLREDGSVDPERLLKNAQALPQEGRVREYLAGMRVLVELRQQAVDAGLGVVIGGRLRKAVAASREAFVGSAMAKEWIDTFYERVAA
jgi:hypothetical protein